MSDVTSVPRLWRPPVQTIAVTIILAVFGVALVTQSDRWARTPAYGNLLHIFSADMWGAVHLGVAATMVAGMLLPAYRVVRVAAHTLAGVLFLVWESAFVIRYLTDSSTTIVNVVSWSVYVMLAIWAMRLIDPMRTDPITDLREPMA